MKNRGRIIATVVLLLLAAGAVWLARPWQAAGPDQFEPAVEESGPEPGVIYAEGRVVPLRRADLAFESNGHLQDMLVEEGDDVEAGAPLIRLETTDAEIAVNQAQAALAQAEANLAAAQARLMSAEEGRQTAQLAIQAAEAELAVVQTGPREQEIEAAKGAVAEANAGVAQAAGERDVTLERNQAEIAAAEARLEAAESNLFAVRIANQPIVQDEEKPDEEREQAQWRLNAAEAEVAAAQAELKRAQAGATEAEAEAAVNAVGYAAAQQDAAQAQLALVEAGARQEEIAIATEKVRQAQSAAEQAEARVSLAETAVRQAEADVEIARAQLSAAETALEKLTLTAPFAGTVADVHLKAGQGATAGIPAVTVADFSEWRVETTDLTELDVAQIAEGQPVQVTVDALPGETIPGEIVEIAAAPQGAGAPSQAMAEDVTYEVTVTLDDVQELTLRWGMTAFVVVGAEASEWWSPPPSGDSISVEGETVPARFRDLSFQTGGTVAEILVKEGQEVESGDPLIQLEARQQEIALAQAQGRVAAAQAALETAENQHAVAQAEVEIAQREADVAAAQLALVKAGPRPEEVKAAEARLAAARSGVAQAAAARDAQLENVGTEEQIESARAELGSAQADLKALQDRYDTILDTCYDTPEGEVCPLYGPVEETTRAQLAAAEARAKAAQAALDRLLAGATGAQQRAANAAVTAAAARRDQAQAQLALVQAGATPEQIRQAEVALEMAQAQVAVTEAALEEAEAAVAQAEAGLAAAESGVEAAQKAMERTTLRASLAGRVARLSVDPGEVVPAGSTIVTVAEGGEWRVETRDLTELDVARIQEGDAVRVSFEALPQAEVEGTVMQIALTPDMDRGDVVYEATIALQDAGQLALRWGMTAQVALQP